MKSNDPYNALQTRQNGKTMFYWIENHLLVGLEQLFIQFKSEDSADFTWRGLAYAVFISLVHVIITFRPGASTNDQYKEK